MFAHRRCSTQTWRKLMDKRWWWYCNNRWRCRFCVSFGSMLANSRRFVVTLKWIAYFWIGLIMAKWLINWYVWRRWWCYCRWCIGRRHLIYYSLIHYKWWLPVSENKSQLVTHGDIIYDFLQLKNPQTTRDKRANSFFFFCRKKITVPISTGPSYSITKYEFYIQNLQRVK